MAARGSGRPGSEPGVYLRGLTELRRTLRKIDKNLARDLTASIRLIGKGVRERVKARARRFADTGNLERSIRYSVRARQASVYSDVEYAPVHQWGGTVRPRGVPIRVPRREFMTQGVRDSRRMIDGSLERLLDDLADTWSAR